MTQEEFAGRFGFSVNTLRHWEQGKRQPEGPTRAYLLVIDRARKTQTCKSRSPHRELGGAKGFDIGLKSCLVTAKLRFHP